MCLPPHFMKKHRILVVEDDTAMILFYIDLLETTGHAVTVAVNGQVALAHAVDTPILAILLDYRLGDDNGLEVCRYLRAHIGLSVPIIVLTAERDPAVREEAFAAGATDFLLKPFETDALLTVLAAHGLNITE